MEQKDRADEHETDVFLDASLDPIDETLPPAPTPYARAKRLMERAVVYVGVRFRF